MAAGEAKQAEEDRRQDEAAALQREKDAVPAESAAQRCPLFQAYALFLKSHTGNIIEILNILYCDYLKYCLTF